MAPVGQRQRAGVGSGLLAEMGRVGTEKIKGAEVDK